MQRSMFMICFLLLDLGEEKRANYKKRKIVPKFHNTNLSLNLFPTCQSSAESSFPFSIFFVQIIFIKSLDFI